MGLGANQILVELPGESDPARVEEVIQSTAKLSIHAVTGGPYDTDQAAMQANGGVIPADSMLVRGVGSAGAPEMVWLVKRVSEVEGTDFRDAQPSQDQNGRPNIRFNLTTEAGDRFYKYTEAHSSTSASPGSMAIVLDNKVREVASIQSAIRDSGEITGAFTQQQANDLSLMLRTGALPASISYLETRTVGPTLGLASIHQGVVAAIAGMLAVMIFMLVYYRGAGINADLALVLNLVILLGFMGFTGSVLTLPGIAGVILTIGMGVDSNVLIFERIREELRAGKTAAAAVQQGFSACVGHDHRYPRDDDRVGDDPVPVRFGAGAWICCDAGVRSVCQSVYRGICVAADLRRDSAEEGTRRGVVDLDFLRDCGACGPPLRV